MTPDDIREASFDSVRKGFDPEQVRDLLARVAFLLERRPDVDLSELAPSEPKMVFSLPDGVGDLDGDDRYTGTVVMTRRGAACGEEAQPDHPSGDRSERLQLADRIDELLAATRDLARWRSELVGTEPSVASDESAGAVPASDMPERDVSTADEMSGSAARGAVPMRTDLWGAASAPWFLRSEPDAEAPARPEQATTASALAAAIAATEPLRRSPVPGLDHIQRDMARRSATASIAADRAATLALSGSRHE